jgi:hypothetical protein
MYLLVHANSRQVARKEKDDAALDGIHINSHAQAEEQLLMRLPGGAQLGPEQVQLKHLDDSSSSSSTSSSTEWTRGAQALTHDRL